MKEIINLIPYYVSVVISFIFYILCYIKLSNHKMVVNLKNVSIILITSVLVLINNTYNNLWIKFIFVPILSCIVYKVIFKDNIKNIFFSYILIFLVTILTEIIFTNALNNIGLIESYDSVISLTNIKIFLSNFVALIVYLFFSIKPVNYFFKKIINVLNNLDLIYVGYLLYLSCFPLGMMNIENFETKDFTKLILFLTFLFLVLFIIILQSKLKEYMLKNTNKRLIEYNDKYSKFLDEYKIYKHNINHKLSAMKPYGNKKINNLIDELLKEEDNFDIKNNNLYNVPKGIKGLVAEKLYNSKINVMINNKMNQDPFIKLSPKNFHSISECIGIVLDNAIEASQETLNPIIIIDLNEDKQNIYIKVGNNFKNAIDVNKIGSKYYSTKNRGSGLGLFSIMRNKLVTEKINIINDFYYIELQIKKK